MTNSNRIYRAFMPELVERLIVLVPSNLIIQASQFGHSIGELSRGRVSRILFAANAESADQELRLEHLLQQLYAATHDTRLQVETVLFFRASWTKALQSIYQPGDVLACLEPHLVRPRLWQTRPLYQLLAEKLDFPIYILPSQSIPGSSNRVKYDPI